MSLRPEWSTKQVQGKPGIYSETPFQTTSIKIHPLLSLCPKLRHASSDKVDQSYSEMLFFFSFYTTIPRNGEHSGT